MKRCHTLENEDDSGRRLCEYWGTSFQARQEGPRHLCDICNKLLMTSVGLLTGLNLTTSLLFKKDLAPGPDGIPYGAYRCAGGLGSKFFFHAF